MTDAERIYRDWDLFARTRDVEKLLALYAEDAVLESPLVPAILDGWPNGILTGHAELRRFFDEGTKRRPNELVRWYRTGAFYDDANTLIWEYPRAAPDGEQVDILELMTLKDGKITAHRIYWGWFGTGLLIQNAVGKRAAAR
ncbi:MAG: nuclear transport factor 2 family protein [Rhodospirillaceae bacterium]|nr:nuclear transport factor 2 family protein [Rhodospirillaceae bacterium]